MSSIAVSHKFTLILKKYEKNIKKTFCDVPTTGAQGMFATG